MTLRHGLAALIAGLLVSACASNGPGSAVDDALVALQEQVAGAEDFETLSRLGGEAAALSAAAKQDGDEARALSRASAAIRAFEAASYRPGIDTRSFLDARTRAFTAALDAWQICEDGAPEPGLGQQCAHAAAVMHTHDSHVAGRVLAEAVRGENWADAEESAASFASSVDNAWPAYERDVAGLANSDMDATPFRQMAARSACNLQRRQGLAGLMSRHARNPAARDTRHAYLDAAARASAFLEIAPQGDACAREGEESLKCKGARERALGTYCDRFNSGEAA